MYLPDDDLPKVETRRKNVTNDYLFLIAQFVVPNTILSNCAVLVAKQPVTKRLTDRSPFIIVV
jgi:hypothetical protein